MRFEDVFGLLDELQATVAKQALATPVAPTEYEYGRMVGVYHGVGLVIKTIEARLADRESAESDL